MSKTLVDPTVIVKATESTVAVKIGKGLIA
jgi:hypothetical protein